MSRELNGHLYTAFADLCGYPTSEMAGQAGECLQLLQDACPEAAPALDAFCLGLESRPLIKMEELYTATFDMQPVCYPYIGYQLFGESYKRGAFMARLNEAYQDLGYSAGHELPDHLSVVLRFLGLDADERRSDFCRTLLAEGLIPALVKMLQAFGPESENPYFGLLSALHLVLIHKPEKEPGHA